MENADWGAEERLARSESSKEAGNSSFKSGGLEDALKFYTKAVDILKPLEELSPPALLESLKIQQVKLQMTLKLNSVAVQLKQSEHSKAEKAATEALGYLKTNRRYFQEEAGTTPYEVKGLFRRAQARAKTSALEGAKSDLVALLKLDKSNKAALIEYNRVKKQLAAAKAQEKKQFQAAFEKVHKSGGMYKDKEQEKKRAALAMIEQERKRREEWKAQVSSTDYEGDPDISFEDWCKKDDEKKESERKKREDERKEREAKLAEERKRRAEEERAERQARGGDDDDIELSEEDIKMLNETKKRGYCYFKTTHTEEEKALLAKTAGPTRISSDAGAAGTSLERSGTSDWNVHGTTWEERDITQTAKEELEKMLKNIVTTHDAQATIRVTNVDKVAGHAQIVVSRKKPAPVFEVNAKVKWSLTLADAENEETTVKGSVALPDIHTGSTDNIEMDFNTSTTVKECHKSVVTAALESFRSDLHQCVLDWVKVLETK